MEWTWRLVALASARRYSRKRMPVGRGSAVVMLVRVRGQVGGRDKRKASC